MMLIPAGLLAVLSGAQYVAAWGVAVHLHPSTKQAINSILPIWAHGHLAPVASWPDRVRYQLPWSGRLHYVTPEDPEHPPENCGWEGGSVKTPFNVLSAIQNYTVRVALDRGDIDLRFLVHYIGDVHQPLHLTGRERGGNGDAVLFERRHMSLHGLWDTALLTKSIREIHNYTRPLPSRQVESALTGSIYDPYVRWIVWEGIRDWWRNDLEEWVTCPAPPSHTKRDQTVFSPLSAHDDPSLLLSTELQAELSRTVCPLHWAEPVHKFCCSHVFPPTGSYNYSAPVDLNTPEYHGKIVDDKVLEQLLAKAGIRLASVLNTILADEEELQAFGTLAQAW